MSIALPSLFPSWSHRLPRPAPGRWLAGAWLALVLLAVLAPGWLVGHDPLEADPLAMQQGSSAAHWLGTDQLGRDVLARVVYGARHSLAISAAALAIAVTVGSGLGLLAGLARGRIVDALFTRATEVVAAFPLVLLALVLIAYTGTGSGNLALALGVAFAPHFMRVVRAQTGVVAGSGFVTQARTFGLRRLTLVLRHVLPHALAQVPVLATVNLGVAITATAGLGFLGMGPKPPAPEWGLMLAEGRNYLYSAWWISVWPGLAISLTVIAIGVLGRHWRNHDAARSRR